jgi:hypothetical protein
MRAATLDQYRPDRYLRVRAQTKRGLLGRPERIVFVKLCKRVIMDEVYAAFRS